MRDGMSLLGDLNEAQREAVAYNEGPHLVVAGAGSGKTRVLTYKVAYLLSQGVPGYEVLALTFTNKAAREMKERIGRLVGEEAARTLMMGTFHSVCARILRAESDKIGYPHDFTIYDTTDSKSVIRQIVRDFGEDDKVYRTGDVLGRISEAKNAMINEAEYPLIKEYTERDKRQRHYRMAEIYQEYQLRLRNSAAMDFDDLLFKMNVLLADHPDVREKYQDRIHYILVDEYQDTNYSQYLIVKTLAERHRNICVVGDDAQSIYAFRGADIRNILLFEKNYQGCPVFKLERNYRSTQNITNAANSLIHHNRNQIRKDVYSENSMGEPVYLRSYASDREEAEGIVDTLSRRHREEKRSYNDMAVLYRTNAQSRVIEDELRKRSIPYAIYGGLSFYQRKEIKDALALFRVAVNSYDNEALVRVVSITKGIGETTLRHIRDAAHARGISYYELCLHASEYGLQGSATTLKKIMQLADQVETYRALAETADAYHFACDVMNRSGLMANAILDTSAEGVDRLENLKELQSAIHEFVEINTLDNEVVRIHDFLSEVALLTDQDERRADDTPRVSLMTIHAAKGLEFDLVCIAGLEENLFPSMYVESEHELEEERRLFYVAITRAKELCFISSAGSRFKNGQFSFQSPSRFLRELDSQFTTVERGARRTYDSFSRDNTSRFYDRNTTPIASGTRTLSRVESVPSAQPAESASPRKASPSTLWKEGDRVRHSVFGPGVILSCYEENGNEKVDVRFDRTGKKTLLLKFARLERE